MVPAVSELTVAVNVTDCPPTDGLADEANIAVVAAWPAPVTCCKIPDEVAGANVASPLYSTKMELKPTGSVEVVNVAWPPLMVTGGPKAPEPPMNVMVPVGVPGLVDVTVAVKVTD
jgi:hypothetical protein